MATFFFWLSTMVGAVLGIFGIRTEEQPNYLVKMQDGVFEVREYKPYVTATVKMKGSDSHSRGEAFRALAGYIFGDNRSRNTMKMTAPVIRESSTQMAMTAPVLQTRGEQQTMTFVMPSKFNLDELPEPNNPDIVLAQQPVEVVAVFRFSGSYDDEYYRKAEEKLLGWLKAHPELSVIGTPKWAAYDPPFALPFVKRNEVIIPVKLQGF